jgi:hypothetical protein
MTILSLRRALAAILILPAFAAALASTTALAAHASPPSDDDDADAPVRVEVTPESQLHLGQVAPARTMGSTQLELSVSSWAPDALNTSGRLPSTSYNFFAAPPVTASYLFSLWNQPKAGDLMIKLSGGFDVLQRTSTVNTPGGGLGTSQNAYLLPLTAGVEFTPSATRVGAWAFHVGTSAGAMLFFSERSPIDDGVSTAGIIALLNAGAESNLRWLARSTDLKLSLDLVGSLGTVDGGSLAGLGVSAGVKIPL